MSAQKPLAKPAAWKNTYFWIAGILLVVGVIGLISGEKAIRDPGQKDESGLVWIYWLGAALMAVNGWLSHRQTVHHYTEALEYDDEHSEPSKVNEPSVEEERPKTEE
ncbi:MAG: hypothetical protein JNM85_09030 [Chthonomonas sp.]|nr:hypothetical protein [Chthonomonas sp.]